MAEGLAIYNSLKRHKAKIKTVVDGFACSISFVIFMAGDERIANPASLMMAHNPWTNATGNADELRKVADDLDVIGTASMTAYKEHAKISEEELIELVRAKTWMSPEKALIKGFATSIGEPKESSNPSQSARAAIMERIQVRDCKAKGLDPVEEMRAETEKILLKIDDLIEIAKTKPESKEVVTNFQLLQEKFRGEK